MVNKRVGGLLKAWKVNLSLVRNLDFGSSLPEELFRLRAKKHSRGKSISWEVEGTGQNLATEGRLPEQIANRGLEKMDTAGDRRSATGTNRR